MRKKPRYREKVGTTGIASLHKNGRIHDFLRGWGTYYKDGSILWDHWRPPTKRQLAKHKADEIRRSKKRREENIKAGRDPDAWVFMMSIINRTFPELLAKDIMSVQPMSDNTFAGFFD